MYLIIGMLEALGLEDQWICKFTDRVISLSRNFPNAQDIIGICYFLPNARQLSVCYYTSAEPAKAPVARQWANSDLHLFKCLRLDRGPPMCIYCRHVRIASEQQLATKPMLLTLNDKIMHTGINHHDSFHTNCANNNNDREIQNDNIVDMFSSDQDMPNDVKRTRARWKWFIWSVTFICKGWSHSRQRYTLMRLPI